MSAGSGVWGLVRVAQQRRSHENGTRIPPAPQYLRSTKVERIRGRFTKQNFHTHAYRIAALVTFNTRISKTPMIFDRIRQTSCRIRQMNMAKGGFRHWSVWSNMAQQTHGHQGRITHILVRLTLVVFTLVTRGHFLDVGGKIEPNGGIFDVSAKKDAHHPCPCRTQHARFVQRKFRMQDFLGKDKRCTCNVKLLRKSIFQRPG